LWLIIEDASLETKRGYEGDPESEGASDDLR
jgi:hypothetical protein